MTTEENRIGAQRADSLTWKTALSPRLLGNGFGTLSLLASPSSLSGGCCACTFFRQFTNEQFLAFEIPGTGRFSLFCVPHERRAGPRAPRSGLSPRVCRSEGFERQDSGLRRCDTNAHGESNHHNLEPALQRWVALPGNISIFAAEDISVTQL